MVFVSFVARDFNEIWIVDLKGNARTSGERRRQEGGNVFDDQIRVGIAVYFCVRNPKRSGCNIFYEAIRDYAKGDEKREFLVTKRIYEMEFEALKADANNNWLGLTDNDFDSFIPIASKETKAAKTAGQERAIFKVMSFGIATNRDEWLYDFSENALRAKVRFFIDAYERARAEWGYIPKNKLNVASYAPEIKWTTELQGFARRGEKLGFSVSRLRTVQYRPFVKYRSFAAPIIVHRTYQQDQFFPFDGGPNENPYICLTDPTAQKPWMVLASNVIPDLHLVGAAAGAVCLARNRFKTGSRIDNITDWARDQFTRHYKALKRPITKDAIFHYVYGVLHDPIYREKYALNLKREFPRVPFYEDFWRWADWGERLMALHIG